MIMKFAKLIKPAFAMLLAVLPVACDGVGNQAAGNSAPSPPLPGDVDLGHGYVRRNDAIHFIGRGVTGTGADATRIDMPSPLLLKKFVWSQFGSFKTAEGLDVASFEALSEEYTRDKDRVYYKVVSPGEFLVIVLPDADPATFEALDSSLARDKNHVWVESYIQREADPSSLVMVNGGMVFKDRDSVHYQYDIIRGADPASFEHVASGYYRDKNRVFWCLDSIPDADPATFEVLGDSFVAKDKNRVFRSGEHLPGLDAASTQLILHDPAGHQILSDKNGIYINRMAFPRAKAGAVRVIDNLTVKAGEFVLVVNTYQSTPVTLSRDRGKVMAQTLSYDPETRIPTGTVTAELTEGGLRDLVISPLPGGGETPSVPDYQLRVFNRPDLIRQMLEAAKHLDNEEPFIQL